MVEKRVRSEYFVAKAAFLYRGTQLVLEGHTVQAGHPILKGREALFRPFVPTWPLPGAELVVEAEPAEAEA